MGTKEWTEMIEKEELIVGEIDMGQGPISSVPVDAGIIPIPENHVDARTVPIPKNRVDTGTVHTHTSIPTRV